MELFLCGETNEHCLLVRMFPSCLFRLFIYNPVFSASSIFDGSSIDLFDCCNKSWSLMSSRLRLKKLATDPSFFFLGSEQTLKEIQCYIIRTYSQIITVNMSGTKAREYSDIYNCNRFNSFIQKKKCQKGPIGRFEYLNFFRQKVHAALVNIGMMFSTV